MNAGDHPIYISGQIKSSLRNAQNRQHPTKGKPIVATYGVAVETFGPNESRYSKTILAKYEIYLVILPQNHHFCQQVSTFFCNSVP